MLLGFSRCRYNAWKMENIKIQIFSLDDYKPADVIHSLTKRRLTDKNHLELTDNLSPDVLQRHGNIQVALEI